MTAGREAVIVAVLKANIMLEPIVNIEITAGADPWATSTFDLQQARASDRHRVHGRRPHIDPPNGPAIGSH